MARNILILGASYGSLLATKLLMAGHNVSLVCRSKTAELINRGIPSVAAPVGAGSAVSAAAVLRR